MEEIQIMAHRAGSKERPNSREAVEQVLKLKPNIIELDVRLSKDDQLVCYHGNLLENLGLYSSTRHKTADQLSEKGIHRLSSLLPIINRSCDVFLDIKDYSISPRQIFGAFEGLKWKTAYIGARNPKYFEKFSSKPENFNFCRVHGFWIERELQKLKKLGVDIVDLLPWMMTEKRISKIHDLGMNFSLASPFEPRIYLKKAVDLGSKWISVYDVLFYRRLLASL